MKHAGYDLWEGHGGKAREGGESGDTEVRVGSASAPGVSFLELAVGVFGGDEVGQEGEE